MLVCWQKIGLLSFSWFLKSTKSVWVSFWWHGIYTWMTPFSILDCSLGFDSQAPYCDLLCVVFILTLKCWTTLVPIPSSCPLLSNTSAPFSRGALPPGAPPCANSHIIPSTGNTLYCSLERGGLFSWPLSSSFGFLPTSRCTHPPLSSCTSSSCSQGDCKSENIFALVSHLIYNLSAVKTHRVRIIFYSRFPRLHGEGRVPPLLGETGLVSSANCLSHFQLPAVF